MKIRIAAVLSIIFIIFFFSDMILAEVTKEKEKKIDLEKEEIFGVLERPNVLFPLRWKSPEGPAENVYTLERSFRDEIFDFVDEERIRKGFEGK